LGWFCSSNHKIQLTKRSVIYIDGFNFYYGALKNSPYKWLNLQTYFERLRQDDDVQKIWYFTARVSGASASRQNSYLDALLTLPKIEIKYGLFKDKTQKCRVIGCSLPASQKKYKVPEEKGTDVNIALQMIDDAYQGLCDRIILVSGDSDLVPTINLVKKRHPRIQVSVYIPSTNQKRGAACELRNCADKSHTLTPNNLMAQSQFPLTISTSSTTTINKPNSW
jgi:6-hydroxy-3-succinoylpyridine 3-monooxygenase